MGSGLITILLPGMDEPFYCSVRDDIVESMLIDLCKKTSINLKVKGQLEAIDYFYNVFTYGEF